MLIYHCNQQIVLGPAAAEHSLAQHVVPVAAVNARAKEMSRIVAHNRLHDGSLKKATCMQKLT